MSEKLEPDQIERISDQLAQLFFNYWENHHKQATDIKAALVSKAVLPEPTETGEQL